MGYFFSENENIKEISFGTMVFGIGLISFTKTGIEIFENHRKDKKLNYGCKNEVDIKKAY